MHLFKLLNDVVETRQFFKFSKIKNFVPEDTLLKVKNSSIINYLLLGPEPG